MMIKLKMLLEKSVSISISFRFTVKLLRKFSENSLFVVGKCWNFPIHSENSLMKFTLNMRKVVGICESSYNRRCENFNKNTSESISSSVDKKKKFFFRFSSFFFFPHCSVQFKKERKKKFQSKNSHPIHQSLFRIWFDNMLFLSILPRVPSVERKHKF